MESLPLLFLLCSLLLILLHTATSKSQPISINCLANANDTANSTFHLNLNNLLSSLPSAAAPSGFHNTTVSRSCGDQVYGHALCRGDVSSSDCNNCLTTAAQDAVVKCPHGTSNTMWYDYCMLRYSNQSFFGVADSSFRIYMWNVQNVTDPQLFDDQLGQLMKSLAMKAAYGSGQPQLFAVGEVNFTSFNNIYGLAQCTRDLSPADCYGCLTSFIGSIPQCCSTKIGGRIFGENCIVRFESYQFYNLSAIENQTAPPPPQSNGTPAPPAGSGQNTGSGSSGTGGKGSGGKKKNVTSTVLAIAIPLVTAFVTISTICIFFWRRRWRRSAPKGPLYYETDAEEIKSAESLFIDLSTLRAATANFAEENKLGEGGFGAVYKGLLPNGREIAVKRLSKDSGQGLGELKNELLLVAKLQHKNLVRLLGVCLEEQEKLLVYEYLPNRSLDTILFDSEKRGWLDWGKRYKIISGIARGLLYLHEESQLKVVHRDLKASNILLDAEMNPKISDFGLARLFGGDHSQEITRRVVGTFGYMAPEYAMHGYFSNKSDVFSFGVMVLEIVAGRKNAGSFNSEQSEDLINYTWENWTKGTITEVVDSSLGNHYPRSEVLRCIHIGLLCVQENPADRPNMSRVVVMLSSRTVTLETPSKPAFCFGMSSMQFNMYSNASKYHGLVAEQSSSKSIPPSPNEVSITELEPR
ncbi:cysteine-rich receptor-like protein kinase 10 [Ananas comosus]|uniref:Cysteine-rich receptor-like protein kinase 10 n=1 Tax=Ananas comosus TaxID=4615 RepID=A0A6P5F8E4_ANACO|nr:cysteine-rich receptor-like protein kinase 10 [Ananas comosus]